MSNQSAAATREEMIAAVRRHAIEIYARGWDEVVEAWTDEEIAEQIGGARSCKGAIRKMAVIVAARHSHALEIMSTAW